MTNDLSQALTPRRPGVVTLIGVVIYIQAFLALVTAVIMLAFRGRVLDYFVENGANVSSTYVLGIAIGELILFALLFFVAAGIMRGSRFMRVLVVVVQILNIAAAVYQMTFNYGSGLFYQSVVTLIIGIFVVWALYFSERSKAFFEAS